MSLAGQRTRAAAVTIRASATLPAAGAFDADPAVGSMIKIPYNSFRATIYVKYTRGASGGQASHKVLVSDGTAVAQVMAPDGTYGALDGRASSSASAVQYAITVELEGGEQRIGLISAEKGVTATPGTCEASVTFG